MPKKKTDMRRRTVFVSDAIWLRLEKLASAKGFNVSDLLRRGIVELLERMEK